jgi:hypothetical protein
MVRGTSKEPPESLTGNATPLRIAMIGPVPLTKIGQMKSTPNQCHLTIRNQ